MKKLLSIAVLSVLCAAPLRSQEITLQENAGIGVVVSDNGDLGSAPVGKLEAQWNVRPAGGRLVAMFGMAGTQTGTFGRTQPPRDVLFVRNNPQAFAGKSYHPHDGDTIIIDNDDITTIVNVLPANDPLPRRPADAMERRFWAADAFGGLGYELGPLPPIFTFLAYAKTSIGASGIKQYDGDSRIGVSNTVSFGLEFRAIAVTFGAEAVRRYTQTEINSYGSWAYMAKAGIGF